MESGFGRLRTYLYRAQQFLRLGAWFPHFLIAGLAIYGSLSLLQQDLGSDWSSFYRSAETGEIHVTPQLLPVVLIGGGMAVFGVGLILRFRIAWIMSELLAVSALSSTVIGRDHFQSGLFVYFAALWLALSLAWRTFNRTTLAAGTLFAFTALAMVLFYATFGSFYLGAQFSPPITDLTTAFYFAIVTMTTVGYGDILPASPEAKWFAISVIMLGVVVFVTSVTAIVTPLVSNSVNRILHHKGRRMNRTGHFIVVGNTSLAINTSRELIRRGRPVTRILREDINAIAAKGVDTVIGDAGSLDVLREAGVEKAECVLAMKSDDSENAFIVLAVRELGKHVRTVLAVNDMHHMDRVRLVQPDVVIAPQVLGAELIAMMLSGEAITADFLMDRIFQKIAPPTK